MDNIDVRVYGTTQDLKLYSKYVSKALKTNISDGINSLSQVNMQDSNTKYIIKWNFDLQGQTITIPENCLLEFDGGSISNGTLVGDDTYVISYYDDVFHDVNLEGSFIYTRSMPTISILTEAEYDALDHYDNSTIYFVKE